MNNLVIFEKGEARTTSMILAEGTEVQHKNILGLVRKYQDDLEEFGTFAFQTRRSGGTPTEIALLNEPQATLIMTYMKNTPIVREFKKNLVRAFFELRDIVNCSPDKRVDVNMRHTRGITNPYGLDIRYTFDLGKIAQKPNRIGIKMMERLSGIDMSDLVAELGKPLSRSAAPLDQIGRCLALLMEDDNLSRFGLVRGENADGVEYLEGLTGTFATAFEKLTKEQELPVIKKSESELGALLKDGALEKIGWKRYVHHRTNGNRFYRFEKIENS
jgi:hypothetical protein